MKSIEYKKGERFPIEQFTKNQNEGCVACLNKLGSFDIVGVVSSPNSKEIKAWDSEKLKLSLFVKEYIPFIVLQFGDEMTFDISINIKKLKDEDREMWLSGDANTVFLFLIERKDFLLKASRVVSLTESFRSALKQALKEQDVAYGDKQEVDTSIYRLMDKYTTETMQRNKLVQQTFKR